ncbi:MAG: pentapeptide repeat-containing protein [Pseudonocardiaceae bacterium]
MDTFSAYAGFSRAQFYEYAGFEETRFGGDATFGAARFGRVADFVKARFCKRRDAAACVSPEPAWHSAGRSRRRHRWWQSPPRRT